MTRTYLITGSASGIGAATAEAVRALGHRVIGVDLHDAEIEVDLATQHGRDELIARARELSGGAISAVVANAGLASESTATVAVNYFGALATLEGLQPLLAAAPEPRAVVTVSMASLFPVDDALLEACLAHDEPAALHRAQQLIDSGAGGQIYGTTKRALALWVRRNAASAEWAGASIPLNAVAPGIIRTPMTDQYLATDESTHALLQMVPMPLNGVAEPRVVADLIVYLTSPANSHLCGQVVFVDGGSDVVIRGDSTW